MTEVTEAIEPARLTVEEVRGRLDRGERVTFLDARGQQDWESSNEKLPGAIRMVFSQLAKRLSEIPRSGTIVTY